MRAFRSVGIASVWNGVNTLRPQSFSAWEPSGRRKISSNLRPLKLERRRARNFLRLLFCPKPPRPLWRSRVLQDFVERCAQRPGWTDDAPPEAPPLSCRRNVRRPALRRARTAPGELLRPGGPGGRRSSIPRPGIARLARPTPPPARLPAPHPDRDPPRPRTSPAVPALPPVRRADQESWLN
jgi:hypothetical protein